MRQDRVVAISVPRPSSDRTLPGEVTSGQVREPWNGNPLDASAVPGTSCEIFERHVLAPQHRWCADARQLQRLGTTRPSWRRTSPARRRFTWTFCARCFAVSPNIGCVTTTKGVRMGTGFLCREPRSAMPYPLVVRHQCARDQRHRSQCVAVAERTRHLRNQRSPAGATVAPHEVKEVLSSRRGREAGQRGRCTRQAGRDGVPVG